MSLLEILQWPDPRLSQDCEPVRDFGVAASLADDMLETMYAAPGRGLAAPQVGKLLRMFVMDVDWKEGERHPLVFVNPEIVANGEGIIESVEGCLSIPGIETVVERSEWVELRWTNLDGTKSRSRFDGFPSRCVQHEMDHLSGLVTFDRMSGAARVAAEKRFQEVNS